MEIHVNFLLTCRYAKSNKEFRTWNRTTVYFILMEIKIWEFWIQIKSQPHLNSTCETKSRLCVYYFSQILANNHEIVSWFPNTMNTTGTYLELWYNKLNILLGFKKSTCLLNLLPGNIFILFVLFWFLTELKYFY